MRFRLKAFGLHLSASVTLLTLILGALYLGGTAGPAGISPARCTWS